MITRSKSRKQVMKSQSLNAIEVFNDRIEEVKSKHLSKEVKSKHSSKKSEASGIEMEQRRLELEQRKTELELKILDLEQKSLKLEERRSSKKSQDGRSQATSTIPEHQRVEDWLKTIPEKNLKEECHYDSNPTSIEIMQRFFARQSIGQNLPTFSGNVKEWPNFIQQFEETTRILDLSEAENLTRLRNCLKNEAREAVEGLIITMAPVSKIIDTLRRRFGRPDHIIKSFIEEVKTSPFVKNNDFPNLIKYAQKLRNLVDTIRCLNMSEYLSCPQLKEELLRKLPFSMQLAWGEKMAKNGNLNLQDFTNFVCDRAEAASFVSTYNENLIHKRKDGVKHTLHTKQEKCKCCMEEQHLLSSCNQFNNMKEDEKWKFVIEKNLCFCCLRPNHQVLNCTRKKMCQINGCKKLHHKLLHKKIRRDPQPVEETEERNPETVAYTSKIIDNQVLLRIIPVTIKTNNKEKRINALLDEASTVTLLDEDLAQELQLSGSPTVLKLKWTDRESAKSVSTNRLAPFILYGDNKREYKLQNVYTQRGMDLPRQSVNIKAFKNKWHYLNRVDIQTINNEKPQLLIGQDHSHLINTLQIIEGPKNGPVLSKTRLGWVLHGNVKYFKTKENNIVLHTAHQENTEDLQQLNSTIKEYFAIEAVGVKQEKETLSANDIRAQEIAEKTTRRVGKRWETGLLWKQDDKPTYIDSKPLALQRLKQIEKRWKKDENFAKMYKGKIEEYLKKDYARPVTKKEEKEDNKKTVWYLPHFGVYNENKPNKIRFVFDASAKVDGKSLNDLLLKGPDLYNSLVKILWNFRQKKIAFCADIKEMFHQIKIREEDQRALRFLWPARSRFQEPECYAMKVMIFGAVSSPFSAQFVKNKNAREYQEKFPQAVDAIVNKHYMDDYLDSVDKEEEAVQLVSQVIWIHQQGGFELRNWISNNMNLLAKIPKELREQKNVEEQRVLGLKWNPTADVLSFPLSFHQVPKEILTGMKIPTKREVLRVLMSIFDPLGLLGHYTVRGKILIQEIWKSKLQWEEQLTGKLLDKWKIWLKGLETIKLLKIPRIYSKFDKPVRQLHVFSDASEQAMAAVCYFRFEENGKIETTLVASRTQVAPLRKMTIPKLELQAALMASRLTKTVQKGHTLEISKTVLWTDSKVVLNWIANEKKKLPGFITRRVEEIKENTSPEQWHWITTKLNIADEATRDSKQCDLSFNSEWFRGPDFLYLTEDKWSYQDKGGTQEKIETETTLFISNNNKSTCLPDIERFSKWIRLIRTTAWILRFSQVWLNKRRGAIREVSTKLTVEDFCKAELLWCRKSQEDSFKEDLLLLENKRELSKRNRLYQLCPTIEEGILRLGGRTINAQELAETTSKPIILDSKHSYTKLLINHYHCKFGHMGRETILNELRQKFWIINARRAVETSRKNCNFCKLKKTRPSHPQMGQIPEVRLKKTIRPFINTGIDFFGPMNVTIGRRHEKRFGVLFTCLSIRAVHIELAESLSTDSTILAIRRFVARRGTPKLILSDNGTNFKGADRELREALAKIDNSLIENELLNRMIEWKYIPPRSPHMGGSWERLVRSVKQSLSVILKEKAPRPEVLETVLLEAENMINSRPLTYVSNDHQDLESITPNHFLIGPEGTVKSAGILSFDDKKLRKQWQYSQELANHLWKRWLKEYLPTLTKRTKWFEKKESMKISDIVVVMDDQLPRNNWPMGQIIKTYPGKDKQVRVVDVQTKNGIYRRPVVKLCKVDLLEMSGD